MKKGTGKEPEDKREQGDREGGGETEEAKKDMEENTKL